MKYRKTFFHDLRQFQFINTVVNHSYDFEKIQIFITQIFVESHDFNISRIEHDYVIYFDFECKCSMCVNIFFLFDLKLFEFVFQILF